MAPPIRILHVVDSLGKGGLENGLVNLISRLDPQRFEHVVCAMRRLGPNAERLEAGPLATATLGIRLRGGLHGNWTPAHQLPTTPAKVA